MPGDFINSKFMQMLRYSYTLLLAFCVSFSFAQQNHNFDYTIIKETVSSKGAVVSAHPLASLAGLKMLKQGGNAVDAAIATQLALAVVYPNAGNIGGGGFLIGYLNNGKSIALDYREKAPAKAHRDMYLDKNGNPIVELSLDGHLSAGVPGTVSGLFASMKYAKLPFEKLIQPAIDLAENGFAVTKSQAAQFNALKQDFERLNTSPVAFVKKQLWKEGDTLIQKDLAATLKRIRDGGEKGFYEGETARLIVAEMNKGNGIISLDDLKNYQTREREITDFNYKGYRILTMPLPSSGGLILTQLMKMVQDRNIGRMGFQTPASVQLMVEAERRAFADRAAYMGDPDFVKVPVKKLSSDAYVNQRMKDFKAGKAGSSKITKAGLIHESEETTHLSVVDNEGNAVAVTTTLNNSYGSRTVVGGAGFLLNDEMDDFSVKPGAPNMYGAIGNEKNAIAPGKRMLSSMTPTIVLKDNAPYLVVGTPGGTTIPTSVYQTLINILEFGMNTSDAVNKPKFHHQWLPDVIKLENGFSENTKVALIKMGYKIEPVSQIGRTEVIKIETDKNGKKYITAVGDRRGDDDARGW